MAYGSGTATELADAPFQLLVVGVGSNVTRSPSCSAGTLPGMGVMDWFKKRPAEAPVAVVEVRATMKGPSRTAPEGYESPYLSGELADELLVADADGMPPLYFTNLGGVWWLAENSTGRLVNVATRKLRGLGIWSCRVRGEAYAPGTLRVGVVELVREPDNPYDRNAVAIHQDGQQVGYFNKGMSAGLAKVLERGDELQAIGISADPPKVVAASSEIMEHLVRRMR